MKIVNITHTAKLGGAELALINLMSHYQKNCAVIVLENGELVDMFRKLNFNVQVVPLLRQSLNLNRNRWISVRFLIFVVDLFRKRNTFVRAVQGTRPDILHVNTIKSAIFYLLIRREIKVPAIWHIRDAWASPYMNKSTQFVLRRLVRKFDGVIANSQFTLGCTGMKQGLILPSPIKNNHCDWKYSPNHKSQFIKILLIGRITPWKGQEVAIRALELLPENYILRIVGSPLFGEEDYFSRLRFLVEELHLRHRVEFIGQVSDVCEHYQWADVAIHTSITPEPFGQVIIEAMSHALPVIATNFGGPAEIITNNINGILISPNDSNLLASSLTHVFSNTEVLNRLSENAFLDVVRYHHETVFKEFFDYLEEKFVSKGARPND